MNLFRTHPLKKSDFVLPMNSDELGEYAINFERAMAFTASCGFPMDKLVWHCSNVLDQADSFVDSTMRAANVVDRSKSAGQCLKWCHYLAPVFEQQLGYKVWITIGQIWKDDTPVFNPTWDDIKQWSKSGIQINDFSGRKGLNLHAWLTVESGEIIEPTFLSTVAAVGGKENAKFSGAVVWGRDPHVLNGHRYFPMAVGREFVEAINKKSFAPLLANNPDELHQYVAACY